MISLVKNNLCPVKVLCRVLSDQWVIRVPARVTKDRVEDQDMGEVWPLLVSLHKVLADEHWCEGVHEPEVEAQEVIHLGPCWQFTFAGHLE